MDNEKKTLRYDSERETKGNLSRNWTLGSLKVEEKYEYERHTHLYEREEAHYESKIYTQVYERCRNIEQPKNTQFCDNESESNPSMKWTIQQTIVRGRGRELWSKG
jgi:hypothetical protein